MGFADLHIHTLYSYDGTCTVSAVLKHVTDKTDLNIIAITDHDSMEGIEEALDLAPAYGVEVIPGCEISTAEGHLLALFIDRPVMAGLSLIETVLRVGSMGGLCIAPHPMAHGTSSLTFDAIHKAIWHREAGRILVGVEAYNGGLVYTRKNYFVSAMARALPLAQVGNSDAHIPMVIGQGSTGFQGSTAHDLRAALENHSTFVRQGKGLDGIGVLRTYIPRYLLRKMGWVAWNAGPQSPMKFVRLQKIYLSSQTVPAGSSGIV